MRISDWSSDVCSSDLQSFRQRIREGHLDDSEVEIEVADAPSMTFDLPGQPGQMSMINLSDILGKAMSGGARKRRNLMVLAADKRLIEEEPTQRLDQDDVTRGTTAESTTISNTFHPRNVNTPTNPPT